MQEARGASLNASDDNDRESPPGKRRTALFAVVALVVYLLDQITKTWAVHSLTPDRSVDLVGSVLQLDLLRNPGAAFSVAIGLTVLLSVVAAIVCLGIIVLATRLHDPIWAMALGLLLGGAVGNLSDRIFREPSPFHGHVVDFLQLPHWPVFNLADASICVAAVLVMVQSVRGVGLQGRGTVDDAGPQPQSDPR